MPRPRISTSSTQRYIDSPLAQIINAARFKIDDLKKKYPRDHKKSQSAQEHAITPELIYTHEKISVIDDFLNKLHTFSEQFDNYKTPKIGIFMLKDVNNIWSLKEKFPTRKAVLLQAIKEKLPELIKKAKKESEDDDQLQHHIREELNKVKDKLTEKLAAIPGKDVDVLFDEIINCILAQNYKAIDVDSNVLNSLDHELFKTDPYYSFTIAHPMALEFAVFMAELMLQRPAHLSELLPFLNPEVLNIDLHSEFVLGNAVRKACGGYSYIVQLDKSQAPTDYQCQLFTYYKGQQQSQETLTGAAYYVNYFLSFFSLLTDQIPYYFQNHATTNIVQSEQARIKLLEELVKCERQALGNMMLDAQQFGFNGLSSEMMEKLRQEVNELRTVSDLKEKLAQIDSGIQKLHDLNQKLSQRVDSYETLTINNLVENYDELKTQLALDYQKNFDVAYVQEFLPDNVLVVEDKSATAVACLPIKSALIQHVSLCQQLVQDWLVSIVTQQALISYEIDQFQELDSEQNAVDLSLIGNCSRDTTPIHSPMIALIERMTSTSSDLKKAKIQSQEIILEIQRQLNVDQSVKSVDDLTKLLREVEQRVDKLRDEAHTICSQHLQNVENWPLDLAEYRCFFQKQREQMNIDYLNQQTRHDQHVHKLLTQQMALNQVQQLLSQFQKEKKIPFKEIEKMPFFKDDDATMPHLGFNRLLVLVGLEDKISVWNIYRDRQENFWRRNPSEEEFSQSFSSLSKKIDSQLETITTHLQQTHVQNLAIEKLRHGYQDFSRLGVVLDKECQIIDHINKHIDQFECQKKYDQEAIFVQQLIEVASEMKSAQSFFEQLQPQSCPAEDQITSLISLIEQLNTQQSMIEQLSNQVTSQDVDLTLSRVHFEELLEHQQTLSQEVSELGRRLLQRYYTLTKDAILALRWNEEITTHEQNQQFLKEMDALIAQQPAVKKLRELVSFTDHADADEHMNAQKVIFSAANDQLGRRIVERAKKVASLKSRCTQELSRCAEKEVANKRLINELIFSLDQYQQTGNSQAVRDLIKQGVSLVANQHRAAVFHKSWCTLMDLDSQVPTDYCQLQEVPLAAVSDDNRDLSVLPKSCHARIIRLDQLITVMRNYGQMLAAKQDQDGAAVIILADQLKKELDDFVTQNKQITDDQRINLFHEFKDRFIHRVHSEDDVMHRHYKAWKPIVANLVIAVLSVGLALGVKFIYSLVTKERQASPFFFKRTQAEETIDSLQETVSSLVNEVSPRLIA